MVKAIPVRERLFARLVITPAPMTHDVLGRPLVGPCLIWTGRCDRDGYGRITAAGKSRLVHRVAYQVFVGEIRNELDHLCRIRACGSPSHLEDVTTQENIRRGEVSAHQIAKTHCPKGHPYDDANTYHTIDKVGRRCRRCGFDAARIKRDIPLDRPNRRDNARCINGHARTADNTFISIEKGRTRRRCRDCRRERRPNPRGCRRGQA